MDTLKAFLSRCYHAISAELRQLTRHDLLVIGGTMAGVVAIIWLSVVFSKDKFIGAKEVDPAFAAYISGYTAGVISAESSIQVRLIQPAIDSASIGQEAKEDLFLFSPSVEGRAYWRDRHTIEFLPDHQFQSGTHYQVRFALDQVQDIPDDLADFDFALLTMEQNYDVEVEGLTVYDLAESSKQKLTGTLLTADFAPASAVEQMLYATQAGQDLDISWNHQDSRTHHFTVENIVRSNSGGQVVLSSRGAPIDVNKSREYSIDIPSRDEFTLIGSKVVEEPEQYIALRFSDPLQENQNLKGLIRIGNGDEDLRFIIENNVLQVYPPHRKEGASTLTVFEGIKNTQGEKLEADTVVDVKFEPAKPAVRVVSKGVILPSTDGMVLPFEAVNLRAVDVTVIKIFEDNIAQFFQANQYDGYQELRRVGRPVAQQQVPLNASGVTDLGKWNRFTLDLNKIIEPDPGALYQVSINFRKSQSVYACGGREEEADDPDAYHVAQDWDDPAKMYWDAFSDYYYAPDFNWEERDNPCADSYYGYRRSAQKNLIASDLGIIAKRGENNELHAFVTDLITTRPKYGVQVKVLDFQRRELASGTTDGDGKLTVSLDHHAFLLVADDGKQRGYLRLDEGSALPISHFNVSGQEVKSGLKGFIYGDRGVWRPGDSLHLNFILEDQAQSLPEHHPVIFELKNPRAQVVQRMVRNTAVGNIYNFSTATPDDAITGNWTASVKVGGASFTKTIRIETIKPNRLRMDLDFETDKFTARNKVVTANLDVAWLSGATARHLKTQYELLLTKGHTSFEDYPGYTFEDEARKFTSQRKEVFNGRLNEEGNAHFQVDLTLETSVPGVLNTTFIGKVFEEGGNFSTDQVSLPYYPYTTFVGLQVPQGEGMQEKLLLTGVPHTLNLVTVNPDGQLVADQTVEVELYQLNWQWWWDQSENDISNYIGREDQKPVAKESIILDQGKGQWTFSVEEEAWGRYYVKACHPSSGHCAGQVIYLDWPGYVGRGDRDDPKAASMLSFSAEKETYQVGEEATIHIPGGKQGRALVSLEDGSEVLENYWVELNEEEETSFTFEITKAMAPNIYVHVTLLQPHEQTSNDLPVRLYGVIPLTIEDPQTFLEPVIVMPEKIEPESNVTIKIAEKNQKPMAYTIAVVDEGLLDITNFETPSPHEYFYAREALGIKTWDLYDYVIGAYGGRLERLLSIGGSESGEMVGERKAHRFKPVVQFLGPFFLENGDEQEHTFRMPNYVGSVRTMVVAAYQGAYGHADMATPVNKPLMVLGTLPRVLAPKERVKLPVNVFVMDQSVRNVSVDVSTNDFLKIGGKQREEMSFTSTGDRVVDFELRVPNQTGIGEVRMDAAAGSVQASYHIEIPVRNPNPPVVDAINTMIEPGETWNAGFVPIGTPGTSSAVLEISSIPPLNLSGRLRYLLSYPHGCVEQIVSAAFPQLFLSNVEELNEEEQQKVETHVKAAIHRLSAFQTNEGAFAYWPGTHDADEWATSYAGHFLLKAKEKGYNVPGGLLNAWKNYQRRRAAQWGRSTSYVRDDLIQAYRLYTLALAGTPEQGAMNRMREKRELTVQAQWRLAAAYVLIGQQELAENMVANIDVDVEAYRETYGTYGSDLRDEAMILETLSLLGRQEQGVSLYRQISAALSNENLWLSTQTTAYALLASLEFMKGKTLNGNIKAAYAFNNQAVDSLQSGLSVVQREIPLTADGRQLVEVTNQGDGELHARIVLRGTPEIGQEKAKENGLRLQVIYKGTDGEEIEPASLRQGTDFVAEVTVYNPGLQGDYRQLALTHMVPSGWEIINTRLQNLDQFYAQDTPDYQDIRDDRVYNYFDLAANERKTFKILLNATYAGQFYQPSIYCEAMYDHTINASTGGQWIEVVQP